MENISEKQKSILQVAIKTLNNLEKTSEINSFAHYEEIFSEINQLEIRPESNRNIRNYIFMVWLIAKNY